MNEWLTWQQLVAAPVPVSLAGLLPSFLCDSMWPTLGTGLRPPQWTLLLPSSVLSFLSQTQTNYLFFITKFILHSSTTLSSSYPKEVFMPPSIPPSHPKRSSLMINDIPLSEISSHTVQMKDHWMEIRHLGFWPRPPMNSLVILSKSPCLFLKITSCVPTSTKCIPVAPD